MARVYVDCRDYPSESKCSLRISGEPDEVLRAACEHAIGIHGHADCAELREQIQQSLLPEAPERDVTRPESPRARA